jgi:uncharacterized protein
MVTQKQIDSFFSLDSFAVIGVSREPKKFGNAVFKEMKAKNLKVYPVHPELEKVGDDVCYKNLQSLPRIPKALIISVNKNKTLETVKDAVDAGIKNIWIQQMSETPEAIDFCEKNNVNLIHRQCVFMFLEPVQGFHKFHRFLKSIFGKIPIN